MFAGKRFRLDLEMQPTQPPILNGERGYSRKGPRPSQASYYYSVPQLKVSGSVARNGKTSKVTGRAWLDREWSSDVLPENAVGWNWTGLNFDDGSALMAFQVRKADGTAVYAGGTFRSAGGRQTVLAPQDVQFKARRIWTSPDTGASYPVEAEFRVRLDGVQKRYVFKAAIRRAGAERSVHARLLGRRGDHLGRPGLSGNDRLCRRHFAIVTGCHKIRCAPFFQQKTE